MNGQRPALVARRRPSRLDPRQHLAMISMQKNPMRQRFASNSQGGAARLLGQKLWAQRKAAGRRPFEKAKAAMVGIDGPRDVVHEAIVIHKTLARARHQNESSSKRRRAARQLGLKKLKRDGCLISQIRSQSIVPIFSCPMAPRRTNKKRPAPAEQVGFCSRCQQPHASWFAPTGQGASCAASFHESGWGIAHYGSTHDGDRYLASPDARPSYATPLESDSICDACLAEGVLSGALFFFDEDWQKSDLAPGTPDLKTHPAEALALSRETMSAQLLRNARWAWRGA
jgi:hypothetical protein